MADRQSKEGRRRVTPSTSSGGGGGGGLFGGRGAVPPQGAAANGSGGGAVRGSRSHSVSATAPSAIVGRNTGFDEAVRITGSGSDVARGRYFVRSGDGGGSRLISLNVGGKPFTTRSTTLVKPGSESFFSALLSNDFMGDRDAEGRIFLDRNPDYFEAVLDILRYERWVCPEHLSEKRLIMELEFYGVLQLAEGWRMHSYSDADLTFRLRCQTVYSKFRTHRAVLERMAGLFFQALDMCFEQGRTIEAMKFMYLPSEATLEAVVDERIGHHNASFPNDQLSSRDFLIDSCWLSEEYGFIHDDTTIDALSARMRCLAAAKALEGRDQHDDGSANDDGQGEVGGSDGDDNGDPSEVLREDAGGDEATMLDPDLFPEYLLSNYSVTTTGSLKKIAFQLSVIHRLLARRTVSNWMVLPDDAASTINNFCYCYVLCWTPPVPNGTHTVSTSTGGPLSSGRSTGD